MKKSQAKATLDPIFHEFGQRLALIQFESWFTVMNFKDLYRHLRSTNQTMMSFADATNLSKSKLSFFSIGSRRLQDKELSKELKFSLNQQHLWLFASAYEIYEAYVKNLYSALGYLDRRLWRCEDFGSISVTEIVQKQLPWFQKRVRESVAKHNIKEILSVLRSRLPSFKERERKNCLKTDMTFWIGLVSFFRHVIVHNYGIVERSSFWDRLEKASGHVLTGGGASIQKKRAFVEKFLRKNGQDYRIWIIDVRRPTQPNASLFGTILNRLSSHAYLAYHEAAVHFGFKPFRES